MAGMMSISACAQEPVGEPVSESASAQPAAMPAVNFTAPDADWRALNPENTLYITTKYGVFVVEMAEEFAPGHVAQIKTLARQKFYDDITFHRVIEGFMAQTGDPAGTGMGGSDLPDLPAEFSDYAYKRGTVGMARTQDPNSANSQFFFCFTDTGCSFLTGQYTVFAQVTDGMAEIDSVANSIARVLDAINYCDTKEKKSFWSRLFGGS